MLTSKCILLTAFSPKRTARTPRFCLFVVCNIVYIERNFWADSQVCICPFNYLCLNKFLFGSFKSFFYDQPSTLQVQASKQELKGVVVLWYFPCQMLKQCVRSKHHVCLQWYLKPPCVKISSGFFSLKPNFCSFFYGRRTSKISQKDWLFTKTFLVKTLMPFRR